MFSMDERKALSAVDSLSGKSLPQGIKVGGRKTCSEKGQLKRTGTNRSVLPNGKTEFDRQREVRVGILE